MGVDRIDDLIVLGRTGPEAIRGDDRTTVCLGGYSPTHGFVRLFPTRMEMEELKRWNIVSVPVENPEHDPRDESWKIEGSKSEWDNLPDKIEEVDRLDKGERIQLIDNLSGACSNALNETKDSIGIVEPGDVHDVYVDRSDQQPVQRRLDGSERLTKKSYPKLYVDYNCKDCHAKTHHSQHIIEWGLYRLWDKGYEAEDVIDATRILDDDTKVYFMIGNMVHYQNAFIIGSRITFKKSEMLEHGVRFDGQSGLDDW